MTKIQHSVTPELNKYDFDGACAPHSHPHLSTDYGTFTLGIFQWVAKAGGKGVKRGPVIYRVKGYTGKPEQAYEIARSEVAKLNAAQS